MQIFFTLLLTLVANAYFEIPAISKKSEMNQISFEKYKNFPTEWNLVTVRYRNDNKELRFIYANNIAFQHLLSGSKKGYPEGSAFGKTAYITAQDPHFPSSMVPSTNRRFQFMVKDSKKYTATNGWGYALFNSEGVIYKEDIVGETKACHACHTLVKDLDYIFASPFNAKEGFQKKSPYSTMKWVETKISSLPKEVSKLLPPTDITVMQYKGPLEENYFFGTLDEMTPTLINKSSELQKSALFLGKSEDFTLVVPFSKKCKRIHVHYKKNPLRTDERCED